jgi:uncharacterized iron-regulated membrane protein
MRSFRRLHRLLGLALLLPILVWAGTGLLFFLKPGWGPAYAALEPRWRPLEATGIAPPPAGALEARRLRTVLGEHLLVRDAHGWRQLDPATGVDRPLPPPEQVRALLADAIAGEGGGRYGDIARLDGAKATTTTGVILELDWPSLAIAQRGPDTERIDALYRLHDLQWTGARPLDRALGLLGLVALFALALAGLRLAIRP